MGGGFSFLGRESEKRRTGKEGQGYLEIRPFHDGLGQKPTQLENKGNLEKGLKLDDLFFLKNPRKWDDRWMAIRNEQC